MTSENITENEYVEMAKHFKEEMEKKDYELNKYKEELESLSCEFYAVYGIFSLLDHLVNSGKIDIELAVIVETGLEFTRDIIDNL